MDSESFNRLQNIDIKTQKLNEYFQNSSTKTDFDDLIEDYFLGNNRRHTNELNEFLISNV
jgi:hypothetical protein